MIDLIWEKLWVNRRESTVIVKIYIYTDLSDVLGDFELIFSGGLCT
ncbi:hypothetical protein OAD66_07015 [Bacteroidia bacterium]|nr:hypothetical protein [Bacteroidia bacterium]MDB9882868.1 hypothetical protein [Bacteroidia bacterium]